MAKPKVAIVYDWLTNMGGAEKLLLSLHKAYPDAPIYTSVFDPEQCKPFAKLDVRTTYLQHLPKFLRRRHQLFPVLRAHAFRKLNLSDYDIIISSASAEAKAVRARPGATHICYCHTPTRYYWSHYEEYKKEPGFGPLNPIIRLILPPFVAWMRKLDLQAIATVDYFIANSTAVATRIKKYYSRGSSVIHPPVDISRFTKLDITKPRTHYIVVGRQIPYKRIDLAVAACTQLGLPLKVYGSGSEHKRLVAMAGPTVTFIEGASDVEIAKAFTHSRGYIFPAQEDFGMVQLEALAAGCPVIAYAADGALDVNTEGETGTYFADQTVESLTDTLQRFERMKFDVKKLQNHAKSFSEERFIAEIKSFVEAHHPIQ